MGYQLSDGDDNDESGFHPQETATKYPEFNEDLIFLVARLDRIPAGAGAAISVLAGYAQRSSVSRLITEGEQSVKTGMQQSRSVNLTKLRGVPREDVARELGLVSGNSATRSLLDATNHSELRQRLAPFYDELPPPDPFVSYPRATDTGDDPIFDHKAVGLVANEFLARFDQMLVVCSAAHSGCGHALFSLHKAVGRSQDQFLHVTPNRMGTLIDQVLLGLCKHMDLSVSSGQKMEDLTALLSRKFRRESTCLVIHNAHLVRSGSSFTLLEFARRFSGANTEPSITRPLVLQFPFGHEPDRQRIKKLKADIVNYAPEGIRGGPREMEAELSAMLDYVRIQRGEPNGKHSTSLREGPAHARLTRQMDLLRLSSLPPSRSSLLLRAAALSDPRLIEIEDPTLGFTGIVGERLLEKRPEFARLRYDILAALDSITDRQLMALRLISTTAHWLTEDMVKDIAPSLANNLSWDDIGNLVDETGLGLASWRQDPVQVGSAFDKAALLSEGDADRSRVRSPLTVKSVIQEHWRLADPQSYVKVLLGLARILSRLSAMPPAEQAEQDRRFGREYFHVCPPEGPDTNGPIN